MQAVICHKYSQQVPVCRGNFEGIDRVYSGKDTCNRYTHGNFRNKTFASSPGVCRFVGDDEVCQTVTPQQACSLVLPVGLLLQHMPACH
jgi:hypothetical protein